LPTLHWLSEVQALMQLDAPLQNVRPHSLPGSVLPAKVTQVPLAELPEATEQAWQVVLHAALQHTPSTQKVEVHWLSPPQAVPCARLGSQVPALQKVPVLQSVSAAHAARHAAAVPLHQVVPHSVAGSVPACTVAHVPSTGAPAPTVQASQVPSQARLQHTPSAQKPVSHWKLLVQRAPGARLAAHCPFLQKVPDLHWASEVQVAMQAVPPPQKVGPHSLPGSVLASTGMQVPGLAARLQAWQVPPQPWLQQAPSAQKPDAHSLAALQAAAAGRFWVQVPPLQ